MRQEARDLMTQAEADLDTARAIQAIGTYYAAAFFAQQAAEKSLKALHLEAHRSAIFTHDLSRIAEAVGAPPEIQEDAAELTPEYTISRYPNAANGVPAKLYTKSRGERAVRRAERIVAWVKTSPKFGSS